MIKRILIVDDNPDILFIVTMYLGQLGPNYQVETCTSGPEALAAGQIRPFDLVISDYELPDFNGLELARALSGRQPGLKLILMSGGGLGPESSKAAEWGVSAFIAKPFTVEKMLAAVRGALENETR